jgi:hypothetical protein
VENMKKAEKVEKDLFVKMDLSNNLHQALVDLLIEKGVITEQEYASKLKETIRVQ